MPVVCPQCGSEDVEKLPGPGAIVLGSFGAAGICLFIGLFLWPFFLVAGLCFVFGAIMFLTSIIGKSSSLVSKKSKEQWNKTKWQWHCKKCKKSFAQILENN